MSRFMNIAGRRFGLWTVRPWAEPERVGLITYWQCVCDCGTSRKVNGNSLRRSMSTNCGCVRRKKVAARNYKHGLSDTRLHVVWCGMIARCENPNHKGYARYGGRGIKVCERWRASFEAFAEDMGPPPGERLTIDRIDNDGPYGPANCRWATNKQNCRNRAKVVRLTHDGETLPLNEWAERKAIPRGTLYQRIKAYGWSAHRALTTPVETKFRPVKA